MRTITTHTETLTIITDDAGNVSTSRTSYADTVTEYLFSDLTPAAQETAIREAIAQEWEDYCNCFGHTYWSESEILDAAHDLEEKQPVRIYQDMGCSWTAEPRAHQWGEPREEVTEAHDTGICYSMDLCDTWNRYAPRIIALCEAIEEAADMVGRIFDIELEARYDMHDAETDAERERLAAIEATADEGWRQADKILEACTIAADELTTEAARAVGNMVDGLIEGEREYYQSADFWREWYADSDERFTRDGYLIR